MTWWIYPSTIKLYGEKAKEKEVVVDTTTYESKGREAANQNYQHQSISRGD